MSEWLVDTLRFVAGTVCTRVVVVTSDLAAATLAAREGGSSPAHCRVHYNADSGDLRGLSLQRSADSQVTDGRTGVQSGNQLNPNENFVRKINRFAKVRNVERESAEGNEFSVLGRSLCPPNSPSRPSQAQHTGIVMLVVSMPDH